MEQTAASRTIKTVSTKVEEAETLVVSSLKPNQKPAQGDQISSSNLKAVSKRQVWDCGSSLYDSFELDSFNRQLDSAIKASSRTLSMPHLPGSCRAPEPLIPATTITKHQTDLPNKSSKLSKSFKKILRSVFRSSTDLNIATNHLSFKHKSSEMYKDSFSFHDGSKSMRVLTTIPEMQEFYGFSMFSPEATPAVRRASSERFTSATTVGVSCASR